MTPLQQSMFELGLRLAFHEKRGDEFQAFFSRLMGLRCPTDFIATRPWGNLGDRKCDGYHRPTRTLFQCFAPNDVALPNTLGKMKEDFEGALQHQAAFWDKWVFVHNAPEGRLATDVVQLFTKFQRDRPGITTEAWGYYALRKIAFELSEADLRALLPSIPTPPDYADLGLRDIKPIVDHLATGEEPAEGNVTPPPPGKIAHNRLSQASAQMLTLGMAYSPLLKQYLSAHPDKTYGDRVAALFRGKYHLLAANGSEPDAILMDLFFFAAGPLPSGNLRRDAAVWTVLAYLFEHCEIFEQPVPTRVAP
jgi:hypothetical protein